MEEKPEDWTYKGSPFLNIGPHVQKGPYEFKTKTVSNSKDLQQDNPLLLSENSPFKIGDYAKWYIGGQFINKDGFLFTIIDYRNSKDVDIQFYYDYITTTRMSEIKEGSIKNPYAGGKYGQYIGVGKYNKEDYLKIYKTWHHMFRRVCDEQVQQLSRNKSYINVSICYEWYNYQNFATWMESYLQTLNQDLYNEYQIDKDIIQWGIEPKIYSPMTCCLIPTLLNISLVDYVRDGKDTYHGVRRTANGKFVCSINTKNGRNNLGTYETQEEAFIVYKNAKEKYLQELADYYYSINAIHKEIKDIIYRIDIQPTGNEKLR